MDHTRDITGRLVGRSVTMRFEQLPAEAVAATRTFVLDSLGVALSGSRVPLISVLKDTAATWGSGDAARVWSSGERVPAQSAAFLNGWQIHNQEWDCVHEPAVVHPMAVVLATLVAFAEARGGMDGRRLITGVSVAVDVATGIGRAARNKLRFFRPAMCGALGATAGMANMLGLDAATTRSALGIAYSQLSGTMQAHIEGSPVLPMQIGFNTRAALLAIELASRGIQGPGDFLEGVHGYYTLIDPSGRATHGGVDGLLTLQSQLGFRPADLVSAVVHAPPLVIQLVDRPARADMAPAYARLCLPYVAATALLNGDVGVADFEPAAIADPGRLALAARIGAQRDDNPSLNALAPQRVEVRLRDGSHHVLDLPAVLGAPGRPLDRVRHLAKFRRAAASGARPLSEADIEALIGLVDRLEDLGDVRHLVDALVPA